MAWARSPLCGPPFLISRFCLSSHALFAFCSPHHSKELLFLLSHAPAQHFLSLGSCSNGNTVGFLRLQASVLILALVFMSCVMNGDFSELEPLHLRKRKSYLLHGAYEWFKEMIYTLLSR